MSRGRAGTKSRIVKAAARMKLSIALSKFTRKKAEKAINKDNCTEKRFTEHQNYHVRIRAWKLQGCPLNDGVLESLVKGRRSVEGIQKFTEHFKSL